MRLKHIYTGIEGKFVKKYFSPLGFIGYRIITDDSRIYCAPRNEFVKV
jgi:hypothetical protein